MNIVFSERHLPRPAGLVKWHVQKMDAFIRDTAKSRSGTRFTPTYHAFDHPHFRIVRISLFFVSQELNNLL
jgi:hypothetical protein